LASADPGISDFCHPEHSGLNQEQMPTEEGSISNGKLYKGPISKVAFFGYDEKPDHRWNQPNPVSEIH